MVLVKTEGLLRLVTHFTRMRLDAINNPAVESIV